MRLWSMWINDCSCCSSSAFWCWLIRLSFVQFSQLYLWAYSQSSIYSIRLKFSFGLSSAFSPLYLSSPEIPYSFLLSLKTLMQWSQAQAIFPITLFPASIKVSAFLWSIALWERLQLMLGLHKNPTIFTQLVFCERWGVFSNQSQDFKMIWGESCSAILEISQQSLTESCIFSYRCRIQAIIEDGY